MYELWGIQRASLLVLVYRRSSEIIPGPVAYRMNDYNDQDDALTSDGLTHVLQAHYFSIEAACIYNTM